MVIADPAHEDVRIGDDHLAPDAIEQLADDLIRAGEVEKADLREIDHRQAGLGQSAQDHLDLAADRRARGARHEVRVEIAHRPLEHGPDIDVVRHSGGTRSGMVI